jgi:hypothetical protein
VYNRPVYPLGFNVCMLILIREIVVSVFVITQQSREWTIGSKATRRQFCHIYTRIKDLWSWLSWKKKSTVHAFSLDNFFSVYFNNIKSLIVVSIDIPYKILRFLSIEIENTWDGWLNYWHIYIISINTSN